MENLISTLASLREWRNLLDIAVIAFIVYQALRLIRGTRAWQMTFGVLALVVFYYMTRFLDLRAARVFLETSFPYFIFSLVVVFQSEIRRALAEIGKGESYPISGDATRESGLDDIVLACTTLSGERIGALIVLERDIGLGNYIESGTRLDARLNYDLLLTLFNPKSPLHDGAVIIFGRPHPGCRLHTASDHGSLPEPGAGYKAPGSHRNHAGDGRCWNRCFGGNRPYVSDSSRRNHAQPGWLQTAQVSENSARHGRTVTGKLEPLIRR